jgi:hypothetical protein
MNDAKPVRRTEEVNQLCSVTTLLRINLLSGGNAVTEPEYEYDVTALFVSCFDYTISLHRFEGPAVIVVSTMIDQSAHKRYVFLDSGANISVFSDPKDCYDFYDESISAGTIAGTTEFHQRATHRVWGEGVYHSGAMYDLVSLSGAIQHGFSVRFERNCFILEKGHLKFLARMQNGLFPIVSSASISSPNVANYHRVDIDKTSLIWMLHLSLDHITKPYLVRMIKNGSFAHWGRDIFFCPWWGAPTLSTVKSAWKER